MIAGKGFYSRTFHRTCFGYRLGQKFKGCGDMRNTIILTALVGILVSGPVAANILTDPADGYKLVQNCREPFETRENGWCHGYIRGVLETLLNLKHETIKCVPEELMMNMKIVTISSKARTWLKENPKRREMSATRIITKVISKVWPCPN